jgi:glycosyltransferase involved in cell wall biosynthesis
VRILTVCVSSNVFGAEIATLKMLEGFQQAGHEQLAVTTIWTDGEFNRRLGGLGIPEVQMPFGMLSKTLSLRPLWWTTKMVSRLPFLWRGWRRQIRDFDPDIVLFTSWRHVVAVYPLLDDRPTFLIEHSYITPSPTRRILYRLLARKLSGFVAVSNFMARHLRELGIDPNAIHVIYNCVPSEIVDAQTATGSNPDCRLRIGRAGQISRHKGHDVLVKAAGLLQENGIDFEIVVFGSGSEEYLSELRQQVVANALESRWKWMGYAKNPREMYLSMDICVVPSRFEEPFGLVAAEAALWGLPVVAARRGGLPEIVTDGETGFLVDSENAADLAEKIGLLAANRQQAEKMGQKGRHRVVHEFSGERMITAYEHLFREALFSKTDHSRLGIESMKSKAKDRQDG